MARRTSIWAVILSWMFSRRKARRMRATLRKQYSNSKYRAFEANEEVLRCPVMGVEQELPHDSICVIKTIAEGDFCKVSQGEASNLVQADECTTVLVKSLNSGTSPSARQQFISEMKVLCRLDHPNILPLLAVCSEEDPLTMIFEYSDLGTLKDYLAMAGLVSESGGNTSTFSMLHTSDLANMVLDVASAVECLHSKQLLHTDISTRHCYVTAGGSIKLAPFQHMVPLNHISDYSVVSDFPDLNGFRAARTLPVRWMSPECLRTGLYSIESDIWSLGVTIWEIFSMGELPYRNYSDRIIVTRLPLEGSWLAQPESCPSEFWQLAQQCFSMDASLRISAASLREKVRRLHTSMRRNNMLVDLGTVSPSSRNDSMEQLT